jgi:catechol 2,3-dioxygenase-like lactoylglutathione lyase family enzyme
MIDHLSLPVSDMARSRAFYEKALAPLGYTVQHDYGNEALGLGTPGKADLWLTPGGGGARLHVALRAMDREAVHAFHREALAAGGKDNGAPGPRPNYTPNYYAAFVHDPDGHNVEVVCYCAENE